MAVTQADIDGLNKAIADGVRQVTIGGKTVTYNTTDSLIRARDNLLQLMNEETARDVGRRASRRTKLFYAGRGYW